MDVELEDGPCPVDICNRLNQVLPKGLEMLGGKYLDKGFPSLMSIIDRAEYDLTYVEEGEDRIGDLQAVERFFNQSEIIAVKKGKKGQREINIAPFIHKHYVRRNEEGIVIKAVLSTGLKKNLNPLLMVQTLNNFLNIGGEGFWRIHRVGLMVAFEGQILDVFDAIDLYNDLRCRGI